jgi:CRISPR-associated protein Cas2
MRREADYLICYDISDNKRLQRLGRRLEKIAIRIQYSVFYAPSVTQEGLFDIMETIDEIIEPAEDDVRIYTVVDPGFGLGQAVDLRDPTILS